MTPAIARWPEFFSRNTLISEILYLRRDIGICGPFTGCEVKMFDKFCTSRKTGCTLRITGYSLCQDLVCAKHLIRRAKQDILCAKQDIARGTDYTSCRYISRNR